MQWPGCVMPPDDDHPPVPSVEGALSAKIVANIGGIQAQNPPCKKLTGSHEIPVLISPKNNKILSGSLLIGSPFGLWQWYVATCWPPPNPAPPLGGTGVPLSPADSKGVESKEYLHFAHIDPVDLVIQKALDDLGITHYLAFRNFKPCELEDAGIKKGHSRSLISSLSKFECYLKTHQRQ
ncbi:uncharacterized protein VP01_84g6 [Puccinia sorghi]|uniref:SAM domain-containing protein n=1 Tax=Puccinia sorghi TaxID=27349 RepID=A0A0L6U996_9BASI|nr:uncharacterized protein VP01_84g6 [Puccinia sorghi]